MLLTFNHRHGVSSEFAGAGRVPASCSKVKQRCHRQHSVTACDQKTTLGFLCSSQTHEQSRERQILQLIFKKHLWLTVCLPSPTSTPF